MSKSIESRITQLEELKRSVIAACKHKLTLMELYQLMDKRRAAGLLPLLIDGREVPHTSK